MKLLHFFIWICFLLKNILSACQFDSSSADTSKLTLECITNSQLMHAAAIACKQKENKDLWQKIIDCHRPMTDQFMRFSAEARCPVPQYVDPIDTDITIQEVFFNICALTEGNSAQRNQSLNCIVDGCAETYIMDHETEVAQVKAEFGKDLPCNIGKCILNLNIGTDT